ncbi:MAG TPA: DUF6596 domain-containing protein, partial [Myxococcaceae bacterium]|nr:DUF6596 domain-containing protein [Myxococcaceae bacterium]
LAAPLCEEAIRLGQILARLMPRDTEVGGLLALMMLHHARRDGRVDADGELVALEEQDRSRWDVSEIQEGLRRLDEALARGQPGPYQIQGAIAALHATAAHFKETDWPQIAGLYEALWQRDGSAAVALNLAIAVGMAEGPAKGLERLEAFESAGAFAGHDRVPAARADLLRRAGRTAEAVAAYRAALDKARNERERVFLRRRLSALSA